MRPPRAEDIAGVVAAFAAIGWGGIGTALMDEAERVIAARSAVAGIGAGMTADYGAAQRLYVRRGYLPDGRGLMTHERPVIAGKSVLVDDDLVLYLTKRLSVA